MGRAESAALELRRALLEEGTHALPGVLGREGEVEGPALVIEADRQRRVEGAIDRFLRQPVGDRALRGDLAGRSLRLLEPGLAGDDARDEPCGQGLSRAQAS